MPSVEIEARLFDSPGETVKSTAHVNGLRGQVDALLVCDAQHVTNFRAMAANQVGGGHTLKSNS